MNVTAGGKYEFLFEKPYSVEEGERIGSPGLRGDVFRYRTKTITAGDVREIEIFPVWNTKADSARAARRACESSDAQKKLNKKNATKKFRRLVNANFGSDGLHLTLTYDPKRHPLPNYASALRDVQNCIRRMRRAARGPIRYMYVIEWHDGDGRRVQVHHHIIISGIDRRTAKAAWGKGRVTADELQPEDGSLDGLATYMMKQPGKKNSKKYGYSLNLKKPTITVSDTKMSRRKAEELAGDAEAYAPLIFGRQNPEYLLDGCEVRVSDFVSGVYIYAKLHKEPPLKSKRRKSGRQRR
jgi:hypothetical protein